MKTPLNDPEKLEQIMQTYAQAIKVARQNKQAVKEQLQKIESEISKMEHELQNMTVYHDFIKDEGFATISQFIESHQEEIKQAEQDRLAEQDKEDEDFDFDFNGHESFTGSTSEEYIHEGDAPPRW